ncbi:Signal transduction histidine kinase [Actinopolymorpha singaporensis]|uniref:Signal transduction histidine kinase n=2 Tax=Actinopolymorpha singaporensis TaxID=117157 RepID=A0A1H1X9H3_9ACTN|nr:Signal transduction histidine kinase [Actinopolymorpha singaporensis]
MGAGGRLPVLPGSARMRANAGSDGTDSLWKALAVLRFVVLAQALAVNLFRWERFDHPLTGWLVLTGISAWTLVVTWAYDSPERRRWPLLSADLAVAVGSILVTPYVLSPEMLNRHDFTLPTYWVTAAVLAWAIRYGWIGGVLAALVISPADIATRAHVTSTTFSNLFLLLLAGAMVGYAASLARSAAADRARATELAARTAERERLARAVHDGVLQVLAYVQRRGNELGGEAGDLARAAGEQGELLRALVNGRPMPAAGERAGQPGPGEHGVPPGQAVYDTDTGMIDVGGQLTGLGAAGISVATPADPVLLPGEVAAELVAAVRAALDNVARHAPGAKAFLLLEDDGEAVTVSVRDDGPGIPAGRLGQAAADGRMGVSRSIVGRLTELGGTATLTTSAGGTEWELRVPRTGADVPPASTGPRWTPPGWLAGRRPARPDGGRAAGPDLEADAKADIG